MLLKCYNKR